MPRRNHRRTLVCAIASSLLTQAPLALSQKTLTPEDELIRAMTLCPAPNNPIANGLRALGGNLLVDPRILHQTNPIVLSAGVVGSPRTLDRQDDAPDRYKGRIEVEMGYRPAEGGTHNLFYCKLRVFPAAQG